jgi:hypothetical protein
MRLKLFALLLLLAGLESCSRGPDYGVQDSKLQITAQALTKELKGSGQYQGVQTSALDSKYQVLSAKNGSQYFMQEEKVVSSSRAPRVEERPLIYWREYFKGKNYRESEIKAEDDLHAHRMPLLQLNCDLLGMGVVYDSEKDSVVRVFFYAH